MTADQMKQLDNINKIHDKVSDITNEYWKDFSSLDTWHFWVLLAMLIFPLIALYFFMDRKKAFHLGFFGFNVHVWFHYIDIYGVTHMLWTYPYKVIPFMAISISLDTSFIPVMFMLLYQWTLNRKKNYYIYATGLCAFLSFLFKPALVAFDLFKFYKGVNFLHLFIFYIIIMLVSKLITNVFLHFQKEGDMMAEKTESHTPVTKRSLLSRILHLKQKAK